MTKNFVWTVCGLAAAGAMLTALVAPSSAQTANIDPNECPVILTEGQQVLAGDGALVHAAPSGCEGNQPVVTTTTVTPAPAPVLAPIVVPPTLAPTVVPAPVQTAVSLPIVPSLKTAGEFIPITTVPAAQSFVVPAPIQTAGSAVTVAASTSTSTSSTLPFAVPTLLPGQASNSSVIAASTTINTSANTVTGGSSLAQEYLTILSSGQGIVLPDVLFNGSSSQLPTDAQNALKAAAQAMNSLGGSFVINGFASAEGNAKNNEALSWSRARVTGQALVGLGVPQASMFVRGHGGTTLFGPTLSDNRRVTIEPYRG